MEKCELRFEAKAKSIKPYARLETKNTRKGFGVLSPHRWGSNTGENQ